MALDVQACAVDPFSAKVVRRIAVPERLSPAAAAAEITQIADEVERRKRRLDPATDARRSVPHAMPAHPIHIQAAARPRARAKAEHAV
jgi:hypothetical protein